MKQTNRRNFLGRGVATAAAAAVAVPAAAQTEKPTKRVLYKDGKKPAPSAKTPLFNSTVAYGNLLFIAGVGAHVPGDIKSHTDRKSTRLNSSHLGISYAVFCLKKKTEKLPLSTGTFHHTRHTTRQHHQDA